MALTTQPGFSGFTYARISSFNQKAIGKLTDSNHLSSIMSEEPADYDKKLISIYTQSSLYSNDFLEMLNKSEPYYIDGGTDSWQYEIEVPYKHPVIKEVPSETLNMSRVGIDGQEFTLILDKADFYVHQVVTPHKMHGPQWYIVEDPIDVLTGYLYKFTLVSNNPKVDFVDKRFLEVGVELCLTNISVGEFDQDLPGLPSLGQRIKMYESLGSAIGYEHTITGWAEHKSSGFKAPRDAKGNPLDILVYGKRGRNQTPYSEKLIRWEPFVEFHLRQEMLKAKVGKMIWAKPGTAKSRGSKQEIKKISAGIYHRIKHNGNYMPFNKGEFSTTIFRTVFGDLFYRRVSFSRRKVKIYTNEAGFQLFEETLKKEAFSTGFTFNVGEGNRFIRGTGQNLVLDYAFSSMVSRETGEISLVHLEELDLPQTSFEAGQNYKSPAVFIVFDISPDGDGTMNNNIREVRLKGMPSMTWGYIDGRTHHLGFAASQGHSAANKFNGYQIFMDDRYDVFIEDLSRCVLIEEIPQF